MLEGDDPGDTGSEIVVSTHPGCRVMNYGNKPERRVAARIIPITATRTGSSMLSRTIGSMRVRARRVGVDVRSSYRLGSKEQTVKCLAK